MTNWNRQIIEGDIATIVSRSRRAVVSVKHAWALWNNYALTVTEVSRELGISESSMYGLARRLHMPRRPKCNRAHSFDVPEPEEYERRKAEARAMHMERKLRGEYIEGVRK